MGINDSIRVNAYKTPAQIKQAIAKNDSDGNPMIISSPEFVATAKSLAKCKGEKINVTCPADAWLDISNNVNVEKVIAPKIQYAEPEDDGSDGQDLKTFL